MASSSLLEKGHLPVSTWYTIIPKAWMTASSDGTPLSRPDLVGRRSSGAVKDVVSCEMVVKPKSAKTTWGQWSP
jgi:hypothetical protein